MKSFTQSASLLALMAAASLNATASAPETSVKAFPARVPAAITATQAPARAPLNTEKALGTTIFGATNMDMDQARHFVNIHSGRTYSLDHLGTVIIEGSSEENYPSMYMINAGAWAGDGYYAFKVRYYTIGITHVDSWIKVNPADGTYEVLEDLHFPQIYNNWIYTYDMAWNPQEKNNLYGLAQNTNGTVTSMIGLIDKESGEWLRTVKSLSEYYFGFAFDYDGNLYAIRWDYDSSMNITGTVLDQFDEEFEVKRSTNIRVDGKAFKIYFQNGFDFDYTTGDIWWTATDNEGRQKLVKINPSDGSTTLYGSIGFNETVIGLHTPYLTADSRTAPARVENLAFAIDPQGADKVTLSWTNPSTSWNRRTLSDLAEVAIYRDNFSGEPAATIPATGKVGQAMDWTDTGASQGIHRYYVVACAKKGEKGVMDSISAFVGHDVPGPVLNLQASTTDGKSVTVSWDAPVKGANDGWFDAASVRYDITRLPDNHHFQATVAECSFVDENLPECQAYSYVITPVNTDGTGTPTTSPQVIAGQSLVVPFSTEFMTAIEADRFVAIDRNWDGQTFYYDFNTQLMRNTMKIDLNKSSNDDILATPPMLVTKGKTYRVDYIYNLSCYGESGRMSTHKFQLVGGLSATNEDMTDNYETIERILYGLSPEDHLTFYFEAPVSGEYCVGLRVLTSGEDDTFLNVNSFAVDEAPDNDLVAEKLTTHLNVSNTDPNPFEVTVYNNGKNPQSDYVVKVAHLDLRGNPVAFCSTDVVPTVAPHQSVVVKLQGAPERTAACELVAVVELANDGNHNNDISPAVTVNADEARAFNLSFTTDGELESTTGVPMHHFTNYTASQTIYSPSMTGIKSGSKLMINRIAWEYTGDEAITGTKLEVYLNNVDKTYFEPTGDNWQAPAGAPLFKGDVRVEKGRHYLVVDLDEPFEFDPSKSLMVTTVKEELGHADFLLHFVCFDNNWYNADFHSMRINGSSPINPAATAGLNAVVFPEAPVLHLSAEGLTAIDEIALGTDGAASTLSYDAATSTLRSAGQPVAAVRVVDVTGRVVSVVTPAEASATLTVALPSGLYVVEATLADGTTATLKVVTAGR